MTEVDEAPATTVIDLNQMNQKMRIKESDDDRALLSKKISYVLRYGIGKSIVLTPDKDGYYKVADIIGLEEIFEGVTEEVFKENVSRSNEDKIRYDMKDIDGVAWIKGAGLRGSQAQAKAEKEAAADGTRSSPRKGGRGQTVEEFVTKWNLDPLARQKIYELPLNQRLNAMNQFDPGANVPYEDYSKVFVAFCKRFRVKSKGGANEDDEDGTADAQESVSPTKPLAGAMPFCPGVPWVSIQKNSNPGGYPGGYWPGPWGYPAPAWGQMPMNPFPMAAQYAGFGKGKGKGKPVGFGKTAMA